MQPETPRQLPMRHPLFADRKKEVAEIRSAAQDANTRGRPLLRVITGPEGIGKTTLAVMACHEVADVYPDAHLCYELHSSEPGVEVTAEEIAGSFLRQLGFNGDQVPANSAERFIMLRSQLAGRKVLVFLDDVERADQVTPLLFESPTCAVVVTSRRPLTALRQCGFAVVTVRPFGDDEAKELITLIAGERHGEIEYEVLHGLRTVCEGLPIALSIAAIQLSDADEPCDYLRELSRAEPLEMLELDGDRPVLRIFETTYRELDADEARAYTLLSLLPGPHFGSGVAAEVLGEQEADTKRLLRRLIERYVLAGVGDDRYRFHSLIRAHARDRARAAFTPAEIDSAVHTAHRWYWRRQVALDKTVSYRPIPLGAAREHYLSIPAAFDGVDAEHRAWAEVEAEWPNLVAVMKEGSSRPEDELTAVFPLALWSFGYQTRRCTELIDAYQRALEREPRTGEACQLYRDLAGLYERSGDPKAADRCVQLGLQTGYEPLYASLYEWHGLVLEARGDKAGALEALLRAMEAVPLMRTPEQEERARALLHMHIGRIRCGLGEFESAAVTLLEARNYFVDHGESLNQARLDLDLGRALAGTVRRYESISLLEGAFAEFRDRSMWDKAIEAAHELARIADVEGRSGDAKKWNQVGRGLGDRR